SSRPTNGEMNDAPAFAASSACTGEKHSVTFTLMSSARKRRHATRPASVSGTLMTMLSAIFASSRPSASIFSVSVATTSALIGPGTARQMSSRMSRGLAPLPAAFDSREGFVVMPSISPASAARRISVRSAVSRKNFIWLLVVELRGVVVHVGQEESLRRRRRRCLQAGLAAQERVDLVSRPPRSRDVHHRTHHVPHHVVQESVRYHPVLESDPPPRSPLRPEHRTPVAAFRLTRLGERGEGPIAQEPGR